MSGDQFYSPLDASERLLASGRPLAPRELFTLTKKEQEDPHNKRLIEEGKILAVGDGKKESAK